MSADQPASAVAAASQGPAPQQFVDELNMFKLAFEEASRALKEQLDQLSATRGRLVQYLGFIGTATAFLVGSSLKQAGEHKDHVFIGLAGAGTALMVGAILCTVAALWPSIALFKDSPTAKLMILDFIEIPQASGDAAFHVLLARDANDAVAYNEYGLRLVRRLSNAAIVCGSAQLVLWIVLVWLQG